MELGWRALRRVVAPEEMASLERQQLLCLIMQLCQLDGQHVGTEVRDSTPTGWLKYMLQECGLCAAVQHWRATAATRLLPVEQHCRAHLWHRIGRSSSLTPHPSSWICRYLSPPSLTTTVMCLAPASKEFSIISFRADAGRCTTSPAAILWTTASSRRWMAGG